MSSTEQAVRNLLMREQAAQEAFYDNMEEVKDELDKQDLEKLSEQSDEG